MIVEHSVLLFWDSNKRVSGVICAAGGIGMMSRVGGLRVTYRTGFGLDDWIYCTLYIHNSGLQVIQRYR
jgi:hypothetical protein